VGIEQDNIRNGLLGLLVLSKVQTVALKRDANQLLIHTYVRSITASSHCLYSRNQAPVDERMQAPGKCLWHVCKSIGCSITSPLDALLPSIIARTMHRAGATISNLGVIGNVV
jgi:hypothetical protein